jgi:hypothetical protein
MLEHGILQSCDIVADADKLRIRNGRELAEGQIDTKNERNQKSDQEGSHGRHNEYWPVFLYCLCHIVSPVFCVSVCLVSEYEINERAAGGTEQSASPVAPLILLFTESVGIYFVAAFSVAQPSTNALFTAAQLSSVCAAAYVVIADPRAFFQSSDGIVEKFQETGVLPSDT